MDYEEELDEDETTMERIWGLREMLPRRIRLCACSFFSCLLRFVGWSYVWGRRLVWICSSSYIVLYLPVACQQDLLYFADQQLLQQRALLLGPQVGPPVILSSA